jgi:hypothetical protein
MESGSGLRLSNLTAEILCLCRKVHYNLVESSKQTTYHGASADADANKIATSSAWSNASWNAFQLQQVDHAES